MFDPDPRVAVTLSKAVMPDAGSIPKLRMPEARKKAPLREGTRTTDRFDCVITSRRAPAIVIAAAMALVACVACWSVPSSAQAVVAAEWSVPALEKAFWACDHAATNGRIDSGSGATCASLTETLKQRKFDGDFRAMLAWWRQHKEAEHLALTQAGGGTSLARLPPQASQ